MRAQEFVTELFQPGKDWRWSFQGSEEAAAVFQVGDVRYMFHAWGTDGEWEAEFKRHGSKLDRSQKFGLTGTGNSAEVMSTVVDIMRAFLEKYQDKIQVLTFSAKEDSRQGLYARMVKRLLPTWAMQQKDEFFTLFAPKQGVTEDWGIEKYPIPLPIGQYLAVGSDEFAPPGNYASADDLVDDVYDLIDAGVEPEVVAVDPKTLLATQDWLSNASGDGPLFDEYPDRPVIYQKAGKLYILDGHHRTTRAWKANRPISVYLFRDDQQNELDENLSEAFDQPYPLAWEKSDYGDVDALARLPDGGPLSIMFNKQTNDEGDEAVQVEFYRNNSQEVTSEGDAMRVFATVLTAIQQYVKEYQPKRLTFSASKEIDPTIHYEPGQAQPNPESRAKLYDRLVQRYSKTWGYRAYRADSIGLVTYELARMRNVAENFADGKVKGKSRPGRVKRAGASCNGSVTDLRARAKRASGERARMYHWCANMKSGRKK